MPLSLSLFFLLYLPPIHSLATVANTFALLSFKSLLSDPTGALSSWNSSSPNPCSWHHVKCSPSNHVTYLNVSSLHLAGPISTSLSLLHDLRVLDLTDNYFTGPIPATFSNLSSLITLDLSSNQLSGAIPSTFCANRSSPLFYLDLSLNNLVGTIPPALGNCSSLAYLRLYNNSLTGTIPSIIGRLPLRTLVLFDNYLQGLVPSSIYNISSMSYLHMGMNRLEGVLPDNIGLTMPQLQVLVMQGNLLHGLIPSSLANATWLNWLDLSVNHFRGKIAVQLGGLQSLYNLDLADNSLEAGDWSFLGSLMNCRRLRYLILSQNLLGGNIPARLGNLSRTMERLELGDNGMTGMVPRELGKLFNLTLLDLSSNNFYGEIPSIIGDFKILQVLELCQNNFTGQIPSSIGKLTSLNELHLQYNSLNGSIPTSLGLNTNLAMVNLSHNQLVGDIPKELVSISSLSLALDLSHNYLSGPIPIEIKALTNIFLLDLSHNQLIGEIPSSIAACVELQYLYMQYNNLSGGIPKALTDLTLNYLDLYFNKFNGELPINGVFRNSSEISIIGNDNLCGGDPVLHLPACPTLSTHKHHNSHILKLIIIIVASTALILSLIVMVTLHIAFCLTRQKRRTVVTSKPTLTPKVTQDKYIKVSYNELYKATNGFSPEALIGTGGYGSVYKGRINGYDKDIAVKVLNLDHHDAMKSFTAECEALRNMRHRNLVKIVTSCSSIDVRGCDFKALVFEFMPNGSLEEWLHGERKRLGLNEIMEVAIDVGVALEYLHEQGEKSIVHCDLKPSNVLLDEYMNARLGDFGLARFLKGGVKVAIEGFSDSAAVKGSIGYIAPEYGIGDKLSTRRDVYSYGILLLEMLTGRRPTDPMLEDGVDLRQFVEAKYPERVMEIVDQRLLPMGIDGDVGSVHDGSSTRLRVEQCLASLINVGLLCSKETASERMEMRHVVLEMQAIKATYLKEL